MAQGKKTGGRRAGVPNKVGKDVRSLAQQHTSDALKTLSDIMGDLAAPHASRVMAAKELLDRGHGKAPQAVTGEGGSGPVLVKFVGIDDIKKRDKGDS